MLLIQNLPGSENDNISSTNVFDTPNTLDSPNPVKLPLEHLMGSPLLALGKHLDLQITYCGHEPGLHDISVLLVFRKVSYRIDLIFFGLSFPWPHIPFPKSSFWAYGQ